MKIIFLDIDQVMNYDEYDRSEEREMKKIIWKKDQTQQNWNRLHFSDSAVTLLNKLVKESNAKVVLCSVWRRHEDWETFLKDVGVECDLIGRTPSTDHSFRGIEVDRYLRDEHNFMHYEWNAPEKDEYAYREALRILNTPLREPRDVEELN
jgi:hypothetical protein